MSLNLGAAGVLDLSSSGTNEIVIGSGLTNGSTVIDASSNGGDVNLTGNLVLKPNSAFDTGTVTFLDDQGAGNASDNASQITVTSAFRSFTLDSTGPGISVTAGAAKSADTTAQELGMPP